MLSSREVGDLATVEAPTWLDRELANGAIAPVRDAGFGRDVRAALAARRQWLIEQQLAAGEGREFRLARGAMEELGQRELNDAGARLSRELGKPFAPAQNGDHIEGMIARRIDLESGPQALVERSRDFTLVPWRDVLERQVGKTASGIMRTAGIDWQLGRGRSGPTIS